MSVAPTATNPRAVTVTAFIAWPPAALVVKVAGRHPVRPAATLVLKLGSEGASAG